MHGVYVEPQPRDPFRASVSAALLAVPDAAAGRMTAARLHDLWLPARWIVEERPELALPRGTRRAQRTGMRTYAGLGPADTVHVQRLRVTSLERTVRDLASILSPDDLVCLVDSALRQGWVPSGVGPRSRLKRALQLADVLSESALESRYRLFLWRSGLPPECLQYRLYSPAGVCYARLDFAWPSCRVGVEVDGREVHDLLPAAYRDRAKQNRAGTDGWIVLRFTWADLRDAPDLVLGLLRDALAVGASRLGH